jgi:hypothetical protein
VSRSAGLSVAADRLKSGRENPSGDTPGTVMPRDSFSSRTIFPFRRSARKWQATPFGDRMPNSAMMSRTVGG